MKIRYGFVSNSSSSSFCLIVRRKTFEDTLKQMDKNDAEIVKSWSSIDKIGEEEFVCFAGMNDMGGMSNLFSPEYNEDLREYQEYIDEKWDGDFSAVFYYFKDKLPKGEFIDVGAEI